MTKNILKNRLFLFAGVGFVLFSCTSKKNGTKNVCSGNLCCIPGCEAGYIT